MPMETQHLGVSDWRLSPNPLPRRETTKANRTTWAQTLNKKRTRIIKRLFLKRRSLRFPLPVSVLLSHLHFFFSISGSAPSTETQPCRCPSPAQTTTWRGGMGTTASRAPPAPTWWTKPGPNSAPWPSLHVASAPSLRATFHSRSQRGNTLAWSTGVCVSELGVCVCIMWMCFRIKEQFVLFDVFSLHVCMWCCATHVPVCISFLIHSAATSSSFFHHAAQFFIGIKLSTHLGFWILLSSFLVQVFYTFQR